MGNKQSQIAMMSFAGWTRTQFGFDSYKSAKNIEIAIKKAIYHGGHRSKIGQAMIEASTWMFQQAAGLLNKHLLQYSFYNVNGYLIL